MLKSAIVFGWGAVEQKAASWGGVAVEVQPRLWYVHSLSDNALLGVIGKEPMSLSGIQRIAEELETQPTPSKE
jgi:hypothetical protein